MVFMALCVGFTTVAGVGIAIAVSILAGRQQAGVAGGLNTIGCAVVRNAVVAALSTVGTCGERIVADPVPVAGAKASGAPVILASALFAGRGLAGVSVVTRKGRAATAAVGHAIEQIRFTTVGGWIVVAVVEIRSAFDDTLAIFATGRAVLTGALELAFTAIGLVRF